MSIGFIFSLVSGRFGSLISMPLNWLTSDFLPERIHGSWKLSEPTHATVRRHTTTLRYDSVNQRDFLSISRPNWPSCWYDCNRSNPPIGCAVHDNAVLVAVVSNAVSFPAVGAVAVVVEVVVVKGRSPSPMACSSIIKPAGLSLTGSSLIRTLPCPIATHVTGVQPCLLCFSKWCYLNKRQSLSTQRDAFSKVILRGQHGLLSV